MGDYAKRWLLSWIMIIIKVKRKNQARLAFAPHARGNHVGKTYDQSKSQWYPYWESSRVY
jgi:hypothetical protein